MYSLLVWRALQSSVLSEATRVFLSHLRLCSPPCLALVCTPSPTLSFNPVLGMDMYAAALRCSSWAGGTAINEAAGPLMVVLGSMWPIELLATFGLGGGVRRPNVPKTLWSTHPTLVWGARQEETLDWLLAVFKMFSQHTCSFQGALWKRVETNS